MCTVNTSCHGIFHVVVKNIGLQVPNEISSVFICIHGMRPTFRIQHDVHLHVICDLKVASSMSRNIDILSIFVSISSAVCSKVASSMLCRYPSCESASVSQTWLNDMAQYCRARVTTSLYFDVTVRSWYKSVTPFVTRIMQRYTTEGIVVEWQVKKHSALVLLHLSLNNNAFHGVSLHNTCKRMW